VPTRAVKGCLTLDSIIEKPLKYNPAWSTLLNGVLFWADGVRDLSQIAELSAAEAGIDDVIVHLEMLIDYFGFLYSHNYIEYIDTSDGNERL